MKFDRMNRRMFLQGTGNSLIAIPFLNSIASQAGAQVNNGPGIRYVQFMQNHGAYDWAYWPGAQYLPNTARGNNVFTRPLSEIPGQLSHILNTAFDGSIRNKMNLIRGLHGISEGPLHNASMPTTGGQTVNGGDDGQHRARFPFSVDYILQQSSKFYPTVPAARALRFTPGVSSGEKWSSFSWGGYSGSNPIKIAGHEFNASAFDEVFKNAMPQTGGGNTQASAESQRRKLLIDIALGDYNKLIKGTKIGSEDKVLLSNFVDHVTELQRRIAAEVPVTVGTCTPPTRVNDINQSIDHLRRHQNAADIAVAALACGMTNIVAINIYQGSPTFFNEGRFHDVCHRERDEFRNTEQVVHSDLVRWRLERFAELIKKMDQFTESNGKTLLDNSFVYSGNEFAQSWHGFVNMPTIIAGGAKGKIETGYYIDFKDRPVNSLLVSIFNMMGLSPADYERNGVVGFGEYNGANKTGINTAHIANNEAKRATLPFLFKG